MPSELEESGVSSLEYEEMQTAIALEQEMIKEAQEEARKAIAE